MKNTSLGDWIPNQQFYTKCMKIIILVQVRLLGRRARVDIVCRVFALHVTKPDSIHSIPRCPCAPSRDSELCDYPVILKAIASLPD